MIMTISMISMIVYPDWLCLRIPPQGRKHRARLLAAE
jgi:hypothetical protein